MPQVVCKDRVTTRDLIVFADEKGEVPDDEEKSEIETEQLANAYSLKVAPKMYRMLADISKSIDYCGDEVDVDFMKVSIDKLIAEARGEKSDTA